jgi:hypothetical protein
MAAFAQFSILTIAVLLQQRKADEGCSWHHWISPYSDLIIFSSKTVPFPRLGLENGLA